MKLQGKVAIVTGGSQGIGKAIALTLAENGADVCVADVNIDDARKVSDEIKALGRKAIAVKTNVANRGEVDTLMATTAKELGKIDILVNNAGITRDSLLHKMSQEQWDQVIAVNLTGTFNCTQAAAKYMVGQKSGKIINVTSWAGLHGNIGQANYCASKAGVIGLTKSNAKELGRYNINVNAIGPAADTAMTATIPEKVKAGMASVIPLGRFGDAKKDVAPTVLFLASDDSNYMTGQVLNIDGGMAT